MSIRTRADIVAENNKRKEKIIGLLNSAEQYYAQKGDENTVKNIQIQKRNLEENKFSIVVVGEFSAGKSTLLNAMMGRKMLPSFTQETTATVNFLRDKSEAPNNAPGVVYYNDGTHEILPDTELKTIERYVSTKGENVASTVDHLDVYLDSEFLKDGVMLVDSPGLNGVAEGHKEITENQIKQSNASIFMFDATRPGSKSDFESLGNLRENVDKIFILLNKIDMIREDEGETVEDVINGLKENYLKVFSNVKVAPKIYAISAGNALQARENGEADSYGLNEFEANLFEFMSSDKKYIEQLKSPVKQVDSVINSSIQELNENKELLESKTDTEELQQKIIALNDEIEKEKNKDRDAQRSIANKLNIVFKDTTNEIKTEVENYIESSLNNLDDYDTATDLEQYIEGFESSFNRRLRSIIENGKDGLQSSIEDIVSEQYMEQAMTIGDSLGEIEAFGDIKPDERFEIPADFGEVGLNKMKQERKELEERLLSLRAQSAEAEDNLAVARANERERKELEKKIEDSQKSLERFEDSIIANRPEVQRYVVQDVEEVDREGVFGPLVDGLFGKKNMSVTRDKVDTSERDEYIARTNQILERKKGLLDEEIKKLNSKADSNYEVAKAKSRRVDEELENAKLEFDQLLKKQDKKLDIHARRQLNNLKRQFSDYCYNTLDEIVRNAKKNMRDAKKQYSELIITLVNANIEQKIQNKKNYLENLESQLESSEEERNVRLAEIKDELEQLNSMLEQVDVVKAEIDNISSND